MTDEIMTPDKAGTGGHHETTPHGTPDHNLMTTPELIGQAVHEASRATSGGYKSWTTIGADLLEALASVGLRVSAYDSEARTAREVLVSALDITADVAAPLSLPTIAEDAAEFIRTARKMSGALEATAESDEIPAPTRKRLESDVSWWRRQCEERETDRDEARAENKRLKDALSTNSDDALCICITAGPAMEGPDEYCLTHGRTKAEWMELLDAARKRLNELEPDPFAEPGDAWDAAEPETDWKGIAGAHRRAARKAEAQVKTLNEACQRKNGDLERYAKAAAKAEEAEKVASDEVNRLEGLHLEKNAKIRALEESVENHKRQAEEYAEFADADTVTRFREALVEIRGTALGGDPKDRRLSLLVIWALAGQALEGGSDE